MSKDNNMTEAMFLVQQYTDLGEKALLVIGILGLYYIMLK